jgi:HNH endonuclease
MRRGGPLRRRTPLRRTASLASQAVQSRTSRPDALTREVVLERDGHSCVVCGAGGGLQLHHRVRLGQGGSRLPEAHAPQNLIAVCERCHDRIHSGPAEARLLGWLVRRGTDPAAKPVWSIHRGLAFLTRDGWFTDAADVESREVAGDLVAAGVVDGWWSL